MTHIRAGAAWLVACIAMAGGCAPVEGDADDSVLEADIDTAEDEGDDDGEVLDQKSLSAENGLSTINGLSATNGLFAHNGLKISNGLTVVNGIASVNGLATLNGMTTVNGRPVNCTGTTRCTGRPNGLLSSRRGLMRDEEGANLASYVVRCALPADRTITVKRWDGVKVALTGELGLTPEWETGLCGTDCQEKISACLLSLVNGSGRHVEIAMSAAWANGPLGEVPDSSMLKEAVFFGNIFKSPPEAYVAVHHDWAVGLMTGGRQALVNGISTPRMCSGVPGIGGDYATQHALCPIKIVGDANQDLWNAEIPGIGDDYNICFMTDNKTQALTCRLHWAEGEEPTYKWNFPLTTFLWEAYWE